MTKKTSSIAQLKKMSAGEIVELPGWTDNEPFIVKLKRPSIQNLLSSGKIPNSLMETATAIFTQGGQGIKNDDIADLTALEIEIAKVTMIEPTYQELEDNDIELTDEQLLDIFQYTQGGAKKLSSFRRESASIKTNKSE